MSDHIRLHLPEEPATGTRQRGVIAVVASVVAVVLIAGGGFAAWQFFAGGGPRPAEVLPASTFALVTVDLNPSGGQKVEAIRTLRKFPSWKKRTGLTPDSDVLEAIFDKALEKGPCKALDYETDVKPWIGHRAGFGGVLLGNQPAPGAGRAGHGSGQGQERVRAAGRVRRRRAPRLHHDRRLPDRQRHHRPREGDR